MECQAIFSEGSFICQLSVVFAVIRDFLIIIATLLLIVALAALIFVLIRSFRLVKQTGGRVSDMLDQVQEGIDAVKGVFGFLGSLRNAGIGSGAASGSRSTMRTIGTAFRPVVWLVRRSRRRRERDVDGDGDGDGSASGS